MRTLSGCPGLRSWLLTPAKPCRTSSNLHMGYTSSQRMMTRHREDLESKFAAVDPGGSDIEKTKKREEPQESKGGRISGRPKGRLNHEESSLSFQTASRKDKAPGSLSIHSDQPALRINPRSFLDPDKLWPPYQASTPSPIEMEPSVPIGPNFGQQHVALLDKLPQPALGSMDNYMSRQQGRRLSHKRSKPVFDEMGRNSSPRTVPFLPLGEPSNKFPPSLREPHQPLPFRDDSRHRVQSRHPPNRPIEPRYTAQPRHSASLPLPPHLAVSRRPFRPKIAISENTLDLREYFHPSSRHDLDSERAGKFFHMPILSAKMIWLRKADKFREMERQMKTIEKQQQRKLRREKEREREKVNANLGDTRIEHLPGLRQLLAHPGRSFGVHEPPIQLEGIPQSDSGDPPRGTLLRDLPEPTHMHVASHGAGNSSTSNHALEVSRPTEPLSRTQNREDMERIVVEGGRISG